MKLYGFANFVEQNLVPYEYTSISLVVIEASMRLLCSRRGFNYMTGIDKLQTLTILGSYM